MSDFTLRQLLEAGVHYGHTTRRWNPKMEQYIFGDRNGVHILDLEQTVPMLHRALKFIKETASAGGRILFVGTKHQASKVVAEHAEACGQYFVNHRWLGGMLTNWNTISNSIKLLKDLKKKLEKDDTGLTKKERLNLQRQYEKLELSLGGIKDMGGIPDIMFVIDTNKEAIAIKEAEKLGIPVIAILDSNSDPHGVTFPIPGNDDAVRAIRLYCELVSSTIGDGVESAQAARGVDLGASEEAPDAAQVSETKSNDAESKAVSDKREVVEVKEAHKEGAEADTKVVSEKTETPVVEAKAKVESTEASEDSAKA
jgi:small subunit ribosomal protein S2